ncbi:MAG TPA: phosphatidate cytidylyltransferase, partial [Ktedonobacteraceae bacterium]|nr:phosphatidate cytidylyltransferase [Ktedonobacteraceae bacterium]
MQPASEQETQTNVQPKDSRQWNRSVVQRVITAVIAIPVVLAFVWLSGWWGLAVAVIAVILSVYELHNMMVHEGYHPLIWMSFGLSILFLLAAVFPQQRIILIEIGLSAALLITFPLLFIRKKLDGAMVDWSLTLAIPVYLGWPLSVFLLLRGFQGGITPGFWWVLTVFLGVWGFDSGAFFSGHFWGKHKLSPAISPAKTWEGVAGGLVLSIAAALLFTAWPLGVPWYLAILLGILIGIAATLGDL